MKQCNRKQAKSCRLKAVVVCNELIDDVNLSTLAENFAGHSEMHCKVGGCCAPFWGIWPSKEFLIITLEGKR